MSLTDKMALVTGASRGIGKACALKLAEQGIHVIGTSTSELGAESIRKTFEASHLSGEGVVLNVADRDAVSTFFDELSDQKKIPHILVNNAAVTRDNILLRMQESQWDEVVDTNLTAVFLLTKRCLKGMVRSRWGRIINMTSIVAEMGNLGQANYTAAKAAVVGFSKSAAIEVARYGITINCVSPGFVDTDMTRALPEPQREQLLSKIPMQRMAMPEDIAAAVSFLASEEAAYITGETLHVNGGLYMA